MRTVLARLTACALLVAAVLPPGGEAEAQPSPGALPPVLSLVIDVADLPVPIDAVGLALNVTVTAPMAAGYLTVYPCASGRPLASNLNYRAGQTVPNFVVTTIDPDGFVCIDTLAVTDVVVDLAGYVPAGSPLVMLPAPARFADTRVPGDAAGVRLRAGEVRAVTIAGRRGVPADATAVVFNATAVDADRSGFLTVFPCGRSVPRTSTLNFTAGAIVPNLVTSAVGTGGAVCFYAIADVDIVADVAAYVPAGGAGISLLDAPERVYDTRDGTGGASGPLGAGTSRVQIGGVAGVSPGATAAVVNLTATESSSAGFVTAWPCDSPRPLASNLNYVPGQNVANHAMVRLAADGSLCLSASGVVHGIVDVAGYVTSSAAFVPLTPTRIGDTRESVEVACNLMVTSGRNGPMRWFDLRTGTSGAALPSEIATSTMWMAIESDCSSVWALLVDRQLLRIDREGRVVERGRLADGVWSQNIFMSDFGPLAAVMSPSGPRLVDPVSGALVFQFRSLDTGQFWNLGGASRDLTVFYFYVRMPDSSRQFHVVSGDDVNYAIFSAPPGSDYFSVSPGGLFMAYGIREMGPRGERVSEVVVVTEAGDVVERRPTIVDGYYYANTVPWIADGMALTCPGRLPGYDAHRLARWDLFGRPVGLDPSWPCPWAAF